MKLAEGILKKINGKFAPLSTIPLRFGHQDIVVRTDHEGNAVQMFIGKANEEGWIKGDRYMRQLVRDHHGNLIRVHWDRKGRAS